MAMTPLLVPADNVDNAQAGSRNRTPGPLAAHAAGIAHHSVVGSVAEAAPGQGAMSEHGWLRGFWRHAGSLSCLGASVGLLKKPRLSSSRCARLRRRMTSSA